jgi:acyl-CoA thioester hydrolase
MSSFIWPIRVYWEDTDAGGIVFYANYLKFMERARTEWLRSLGVSQSQLQEHTGCMFVVTRTDVRYAASARLDDALSVRTRVVSKARASMVLEQEICKTPPYLLDSSLSNTEQMRSQHASQLHTKSHEHGSDKLLCQGTIEIAWVSSATLKPSRIPQSLLELMS